MSAKQHQAGGTLAVDAAREYAPNMASRLTFAPALAESGNRGDGVTPSPRTVSGDHQGLFRQYVRSTVGYVYFSPSPFNNWAVAAIDYCGRVNPNTIPLQARMP